MADYFTHFSCLLDVGTPENAAHALDLYNALAAEGASEEPPSEGFQLSIQPEHGGTKLWMHDEIAGDPERLIQFVKRVRADGTVGIPIRQHMLVSSSRRLWRWRERPRSRHRRDGRLDLYRRLARRNPLRRGSTDMSIPDHARNNFQTLLRAAADGNLALMECLEPETGAQRYVICAVGRDGGDFVFTPFGHLADGNPYDAYLPPDPDDPGGFVRHECNHSRGRRRPSGRSSQRPASRPGAFFYASR